MKKLWTMCMAGWCFGIKPGLERISAPLLDRLWGPPTSS